MGYIKHSNKLAHCKLEIKDLIRRFVSPLPIAERLWRPGHALPRVEQFPYYRPSHDTTWCVVSLSASNKLWVLRSRLSVVHCAKRFCLVRQVCHKARLPKEAFCVRELAKSSGLASFVDFVRLFFRSGASERLPSDGAGGVHVADQTRQGTTAERAHVHRDGHQALQQGVRQGRRGHRRLWVHPSPPFRRRLLSLLPGDPHPAPPGNKCVAARQRSSIHPPIHFSIQSSIHPSTPVHSLNVSGLVWGTVSQF